MTNEEVVLLIENEFLSKTLGATAQYLEIHQPALKDGKIRIERIDREKEDDLIIVYLPVVDEYFYFAVYIDAKKKDIFNVGMESRNTVYFRAESEIINLDILQSFTTLQPTRAWNIGDLRPDGRRIYNFNCIEFTPNPEADEFEDKLEKLLTFLQKDIEGVRTLAANANAFVQVIMDFHAGNQRLGGMAISSKHVQLLSSLNLAIYFDVTAWGEPFN
jgi:hypothetical protein